MADIQVHIIARDIQRHDAIGNFCRQIHGFLSARGFKVTLAAENCHPDDRPSIARLDDIIPAIAPQDVILFHFSTEDPAFPALAKFGNPKILYFHNITPERFFASIDARTARLVRLGLEQRPLAAAFDVLMANSVATARILHAGLAPDDRRRIPETGIVVCPPIVNIDRWTEIAEQPTNAAVDSRTMLQVGRLAPHKGLVELLDGFAVLAARDPTARLLLVGQPSTPVYLLELTAKVKALQPAIAQRIQFLHGISDGELKSIYRNVGVCVAMSLHEGFGVPPVDALAFDKPLVIRAEAGMIETITDAAIITDGSTPAAIADALGAALDDEARRATLALARRSRLDALRRLADGRIILDAVNRARDLHRARVV